MRRKALSLIMALIYLAVSMPQMTAATEPVKWDIKAQLDSIPAGTVVEVMFSNHTKVIGRMKSFTDERLVLDDGTRLMEYFVSEITSVKKYLLGASDLQLSSKVLGTVILNEKVKAMTRDGGYVEGKVVQATEETLIIDVSKSEPKGRFSGLSRIFTADIGTVYMKKGNSIAAPVAFGVIGGSLSLLGMSYLAYRTKSDAVAILAIGGTAAGAAAGAYIGREAFKKTITISVTQ